MQELLSWEREREERWDYVGGNVREWSGDTVDHAQIIVNMPGALHRLTRGSGCYVYGSRLKLLTVAAEASFYPDVTVRCGQHVGQADTIDDPVIVAEVLSKGAAECDLITKRGAYQTIPALRAFAFVSQLRPHVLLYVRDEAERWQDVDVEGLGETLRLDAIGAELTLAEVYEDTTVAQASGETDPATPPAR